MKKQKQEKITRDPDHMWLRVVGFVLALVVAAAAFSNGVLGIGRKDRGYNAVEADTAEEALLYAKDIRFMVYFDGSSSDIKQKMNEIKSVYSPALLRVYKLLDAETEYAGLANIATLNARIGEDVAVGEELYRVLLDAQALTLERQGYSVFDGAFSRAWRDIRYLTEPGEYDPLRSETERERLARLCKAGQDLSNFRLTVVDEEQHILRLELSESYRALLRELEQEGPILDLGLLHDAYELRLMAEKMELAGYSDGYLSMDSGVTAVLSGNPEGELCLYGRTEEGVSPAAETPAAPGRAASMMRAFAQTEGEPDYYEIDGLLRHPWLPSDGVYRNQLLAALVVADDPVTAAFLTLRLQTLDSAEALRAFALSSDAVIAYVLNDGAQTVYANSEEITACEDYRWRLEALA